MIQIIGAFCIVLGLLFATVYGLKYIQKKQWFVKLGLKSKNIQLIDSYAIDQKNRIVSIRHDDDMYLILIGSTTNILLKGPTLYVPCTAVSDNDFLYPKKVTE